jgi:hypothetical protein
MFESKKFCTLNVFQKNVYLLFYDRSDETSYSFPHKGLNILFVTDLDDRYAKMGILNNGNGY